MAIARYLGDPGSVWFAPQFGHWSPPPLDGVVGPSLVRGDWLTSRLTAGGADCIQVVGT
jgi:hypothetical protein